MAAPIPRPAPVMIKVRGVFKEYKEYEEYEEYKEFEGGGRIQEAGGFGLVRPSA